MPQRARRARSILVSKRNTELCYELFGSYLIKEHRDLVTAFLDATGVKHEEGMVEDLDHNAPAAKKLADAVTALDQKFSPDDVTLYLSMCAEQWPQVPELEEIWRKRLG